MSNWLTKVAGYLPDVLGAVATGGASIPLTAARIISKEVFGEEVADVAALDAKMNALSSDELFQLRSQLQKANSGYKVAELQAETRRLEIQADGYRAELADTQNARAQNKGHPMTVVMSLLAVALFSGVFAAIVWLTIPEGSREIVVYMAGQASGFAASAFVYWLGAARGNPAKRDAV